VSIYLYLSMVPEALIASMLPPVEFGSYLAVGTQKRTRGYAVFFSVEGYDRSSEFDLEGARRRCVPHSDGQPKHSAYVIRNLYLVTADGRVLEISPTRQIPEHTEKFHLYQEICPVHPRIVSSLGPREFSRHITSPDNPVHVPKICFVDLRLGELADDPADAEIRDLPYYAIEHLRDCIIQIKENPGKHTKVVDRTHPQVFPYRVVETGIYLADRRELMFYPFPSEEEMQTRHYEWWRSASIMGDVPGL
jgi:hypothetical protein